MINIFKAIRTRRKLIKKLSDLEFSVEYLESDRKIYTSNEYNVIKFRLESKIELLKSLL